MKSRFILSELPYVSAIAFCIFSAFLMQGCMQVNPEALDAMANAILEMANVQGGLIVHINCGDGALTEALKVNDSYLVQGLDTSPANVEKARQYIVSKAKYGPISVDRLMENRLPYKDNMVNLIVSENLGAISMNEVMRVLAPNGVAIIKGVLGWNKTVKSKPSGLDEWNQYMYSAQGNMVSNDQVIGPIKNYQWIGSPQWARTHETTSGLSALVSANGRVFYILDEGPRESIQLPAEQYLEARDAYNGTVLWKLPIADWQNHLFPPKSGPDYMPRRLIAIGDRVYVTMGINDPLSELDAATGKTLRTFTNTEKTSEVIYDGGVLFLLVGRPEKSQAEYAPQITYVWDNSTWARGEWAWGKGQAQIKAIRVSDGTTLWTKSDPVAPLSLTADSNSVYYFDGSSVVCVNRTTGSEKWKSASITTQAITTAYSPRIIVYKDVLFFSNNSQRNIVALSVSNGNKLWEAQQPASGHFAPEDMFVINDLLWTGATANQTSSGDFTGRDIHSGNIRDQIPGYSGIYWWHQRCYPSRATSKFILPSRTGIEFVDLSQKNWTVNDYTRGSCIYGIMPSNGLIYTPPNACACYPEAKLDGFGALAPAADADPNLRVEAAKNRLEQGPAYNTLVEETAGAEDWPTFRHDAGRSAFNATEIPSNVQSRWSINLGGKLSSPVVSGSRVFVAKVDAHAIYALDTATGSVLWSYIAGGRVDSPPTIYQGRVLFGSADGYVYCLNASNGVLIWRFRVAPMDRRMVAYEQVESVWPVHGSVLVQNDTVYCVAGRSMFMDGGLRFVRLNPQTGQMLSESVLNELDDSGNNLQTYIPAADSKNAYAGLNMPVALPDILSSDGKYIYMRSQQFDLTGKRMHIGVRDIGDQTGEGAHVFSPTGFMGNSTQFVRSFIMYGKSVLGGWGQWEISAWLIPSGKLIAVDDQNVYGYQPKPEFLSESIIEEYQLYAASKSSSQQAINRVKVSRPVTQTGDWRVRQALPIADQTALDFKWRMDKPQIQARALVLANRVLFVAGPRDIVDEEAAFFQLDNSYTKQQLADQSEVLKGKEGGWLWAVSATTGKKVSEYKLDSLPVWDGMIAAGGKLYIATMNGELISYSNASH
jgi:outer membrane protein assembly factor BamB